MDPYKYLCLVSCVLCLCIQSLAFGQSADPENPNQKRNPPSLLSELGDLFLHVDETLYKLASPREQNEISKEEQTASLGRSNLRNNYFEQVRQNYEDLQKRIQESLENPTNVFRPPEIMNLNFQNRGQKSFLDLSLPFLPMNVQLKGKEIKHELKSRDDDLVTKLPKVESPFSDFSGSINIGGDISNLGQMQSDPIVDKDKSTNKGGFQKRSNRYDRGTSYGSNKHRGHSSPRDQTSMPGQVLDAENDDEFSSTESDVEGRVLGDLLYSEDTFDKHFKRVLKDGKWIVDPKVFLPKEVIENVRDFTKNQLTKSEKRKGNQAEVFSQITNTKDTRDKFFKRQVSESETKSDILLAFTLDGLPLKLKINSLHGNPLKYLNRVLITAGVSLNIPIDSHRSLQPVGQDVIQLGSRSDGGQTHATYIDLNDEYQLNSLLKALKKTKS